MYTVQTEIIFGIAAAITFVILYKALKKMNIPINEKTLLFGISIAILGSFLRILEDAKIFSRNFFTVTPGVWYVAAGIGFLELVILKILKKDYNFGVFINSLLSSFLFFMIYQKSQTFNIIIIASLLPLTPLLLIKDKSLFFLLFFSGLDSIVPIFSTNFLNYVEQHPIPRTLMNIHPILYPIIRLSFSYAVFLVLDEENDFERAILYGIILISAVTSVRSFFRALLGV